jgi:hypothetical protein
MVKDERAQENKKEFLEHIPWQIIDYCWNIFMPRGFKLCDVA